MGGVYNNWYDDTSFVLSYQVDDSSASQQILDINLPRNTYISPYETIAYNGSISGTPYFLELTPRPVYYSPLVQTFDVTLTLGAGLPAGILTAGAYPPKTYGSTPFDPIFDVTNISLSVASQSPYILSSTSDDAKLDYIASTGSLLANQPVIINTRYQPAVGYLDSSGTQVQAWSGALPLPYAYNDYFNKPVLNMVGANNSGYYFFGWFDSPTQSTAWPVWGPSRNLQEIWTDYQYQWNSVLFDDTDQRQNLTFQVTTNPTAIVDVEPVYQQYDVTTTSTVSELDPTVTLRPVYVTETVTTGLQVQTESVPVSSGSVHFDSLHGRSLNITATGSIQIQGNISTASDGALSINSADLEISSPTAPFGSDSSTAGSTLQANTINLMTANGLQLGSGVVLSGVADVASQSINLNAGSGTLQSEAMVAPTVNLSLAGAELSLLGDQTLQAENVTLDFGDQLSLQASEAEGQTLLLQHSDTDNGVTPTFRLRSPEASATLQLNTFMSTLPFAVDAAGTLELTGGDVSGQRLDLVGGHLSVSSLLTSLTASDHLSLSQHSSDALIWNNPIPTAPGLSLSTGGNLVMTVNTNDLQIHAGGNAVVRNLSTGSTSVKLSGSGVQQLDFAGPVDLRRLDSGNGDVTISVSSGDLQLGVLKQSIGGSLVLNVPDGQITTQQGTVGFERTVGSLTANAQNNVDLQLRRLQRLNASSQSGALLITVDGAKSDLLEAESLIVDDLHGQSVTLDAGISALAIPYASQIQAANLSLTTRQGLLINSSETTYLNARDQLDLSYNNLQADPEQVILATTSAGGSITLSMDQMSLADAVPKLPLLQSDIVEISGWGGLRLTDQSFNDQQIISPIYRLLFKALQGVNDLIPARWPYELDLEDRPNVKVTQLLEDNAGIPYVYKRIPGDALDAPGLYSHYQPNDQDAAGYPYLYQAISTTATSDNFVVQFRSNEKLLTAANLDLSQLFGVSADAIDPTTISPVLVPSSPASVHAVFQTGTPEATAIISDLVPDSKATVVQDRADGSLTPTRDLLELLDFVPGLVNGTAAETLQGGIAWLDLNNNLIQDPQERRSTIAYAGRIRSPLSADSTGADLLVARAPQNATPDRLMLLGSVDHPILSVESTVDVLLGRKDFNQTLVGPLQPEDKISWSGAGISLAPTSSGAKFVHFDVAEAEWLASQHLTLLIYRTDEQRRVLRADGLQLADSLEQAVVARFGATKDDAGSTQFASSSDDVRLDPGQELQVMLVDANSTTVMTPAWKVDASGNVITFNLDSSPLLIHASLTEANRVDLQSDLAHSSGLGELLFFEQQDKIDVQFLSSCANTNTLAFVKVDVSLDSVSGTTQLSVAGRPFSNTDAFRDHLLQHLEPDFRVSQGGGSNQSSNHVWTVSSTGYYTPIIISQLGDVFSLGSQLNRDRRVHLNWIGDGVYAFEDLSADQGSDFDYNDAVIVVRK